jgi:hypothetical protein
MGEKEQHERHLLKYTIESFFRTTSHKQLELELYPLENFLANYVKEHPDQNVELVKHAQTLVNAATEELKKHRVHIAWALFYEAELLEYNLMSEQERNARAGKILFEDANVLNYGAKQNVYRLIGEASGGNWKLQKHLEPENVVEARRIIQRHYNNQYTYLGLVLTQLSILAIIAFSTTLLAALALGGMPDNISTTNSLFWCALGLFGAIGGSISGLLSLKQAFSQRCDTPERILNKWTTIAKPIIGFVDAIVIGVFLIGGLFQVADLAIGNYLIFGVAFISGFSERLIIGAVTARLP